MDDIKVSREIKDKIITDYMLRSYHWTIGVGMFMVGFLLGILITK
jgi:hypothetical protein